MKELLKNLKFAWKYAKNQKKKIILFVFFSFFQIIISVVVPIISASVIVSLTNNELRQVIFMAIVLFGIEIFRNGVNFCCKYFSNVVYRETFTKVQLDLGKTILSLQNTCIDQNSSGVFIQRLTNDTSKIADIFNVLSFDFSDILTDVGVFVAILIIDFRIFLFVLFMIFIVGWLEYRKISIYNKMDKEFRHDDENVAGFVGELVRGVRDIKMLDAEESFIQELHTRLIDLNKKRYSMSKVKRNYQFVSGFFYDFFDLILICLLVYLISINQLTIAAALVVHNYMSHVGYIVYSCSSLLESIKDFNLSTNRIFEVIYGSNFPKEEFGTKKLRNIQGNFEFRNVFFGYSKEKNILKDLSFRVKAHSTVAFVGRSGIGKTTIFHLLCKMYNPVKGKILIDNVDIAELDRQSIRSNITIISQNPYIFNVSIRDNLRLVKEDLTEDEMVEACRLACLDEFIQALPNRYDTIVGEGGISLSGGQRQRLAIARAFVQQTQIILFDEATSALDNITQNKIQKAIENLQNKYTILIIAHRLSTIIHSDCILFLDDGHVIAQGTHEELLEKCQDYRNLYESEIEK